MSWAQSIGKEYITLLFINKEVGLTQAAHEWESEL